MVIREAVGFAEPQPEDRLHENELQIVPLVEAQISEGFRLTWWPSGWRTPCCLHG
jgi:hypothetical protein